MKWGRHEEAKGSLLVLPVGTMVSVTVQVRGQAVDRNGLPRGIRTPEAAGAKPVVDSADPVLRRERAEMFDMPAGMPARDISLPGSEGSGWGMLNCYSLPPALPIASDVIVAGTVTGTEA